MATQESLAECPRCGRSAISGDTLCSRCQRLPVDDASPGECQFCGTAVSKQFRRVFGDNVGRAHACHECSTQRELYEGAAAQADHTPDSIERGHTSTEELTR